MLQVRPIGGLKYHLSYLFIFQSVIVEKAWTATLTEYTFHLTAKDPHEEKQTADSSVCCTHVVIWGYTNKIN